MDDSAPLTPPNSLHKSQQAFPWKGLWGLQRELCLLIDTGGFHFPDFFLSCLPAIPAFIRPKLRAEPRSTDNPRKSRVRGLKSHGA